MRERESRQVRSREGMRVLEFTFYFIDTDTVVEWSI
jgi:hypothetical protein